MRIWQRVAFRERCGGCGELLAQGQPVLVITMENVKRKLFRCAVCEGPSPPDLPPLIEKHQTTKRMQPIAKAIPADYSARRLGERE